VRNRPTKISAKKGTVELVRIDREISSQPTRAGMPPMMSAA